MTEEELCWAQRRQTALKERDAWRQIEDTALTIRNQVSSVRGEVRELLREERARRNKHG